MNLPLWSVLPFVALLLSIAILPLAVPHFWEPNKNKAIISCIFGLPVGIYFIFANPRYLMHIEHEYFSFIVLLGTLFIISGGIFLRGDIQATPINNSIFLLIGSILASFIGTTGAAMLLIRAVLNINKQRKHICHTVIFFIFCVANIGGCLTPLGDPPLFLGYLKGVPFSWTFQLLPEWLFMNVILIVLYFIIDAIMIKRERKKDLLRDEMTIEPIRVIGGINFIFLLGVILTVAFIPMTPWRELIMFLLVGLSLKLSSREARTANKFTFSPIIEVAVLFFGIFLAMMPALVILSERGASLGLMSPAQFFWCTGSLSSFLDNAPTYAVFFELAKAVGGGVGELVAGVPEELLRAISIGAVFMGANTYIGNGPNFMVKAISEEAGVKMPSFFGYMLWSGCILIPLFVVVTFIFF
ncbi:MAG: sodium:proton antiporter [Candidatus Hydrogenedentota bacterium]